MSLLGKFSFVLFLAYKYSAGEVADYSIVSVTVAYMTILLGGEFFNFSSRELMHLKEKRKIVSSHFYYNFIFCILPFVLIFNLSATKILLILNVREVTSVYLSFLIIMEFYGLDLYRILISLESNTFANVLLFIRSSLWCLIVIGIYLVTKIHYPFIYLLYLWLFFSFLANLVGLIYLLKNNFIQFQVFPLSWFFKGVRASWMYLIPVACSQFFLVIDKYLIREKSGVGELAAYSIYLSIAFAIFALIDTSVINQCLPTLVKLRNDRLLQLQLFFKMLKDSLVLYLLFVLIAIFTIKPLLEVINKSEYIDSLLLLYILLVGVGFHVLDHCCSRFIYSNYEDRYLVKINTVVQFFVIGVLIGCSLLDIREMSLLVSIGYLLIYFTLSIIKIIKIYLEKVRSK